MPLSYSKIKFLSIAAIIATVTGGSLVLHTVDTTPAPGVTYHVDSQDRTSGYKGKSSARIYLTNVQTGEQSTVETADLLTILHFTSSDVYHALGTLPTDSSIEITEQRGVRIPLISEFPNIISFKVVDGAK